MVSVSRSVDSSGEDIRRTEIIQPEAVRAGVDESLIDHMLQHAFILAHASNVKDAGLKVLKANAHDARSYQVL